MHTSTLRNLARLLADRGAEDEAAELYARGTDASPLSVDMWRARAHHLRRIGRDEEAIGCYETVLRFDPGDSVSEHLLRGLRGDSIPAASRSYVQALFDRFAESYDDRYSVAVGYRAASVLAEAVSRTLEQDSARQRSGGTRLRLLDLGCGTGLFLEHLGRLPTESIGVDLSIEMLARARAKGLYSRLEQMEVLAALTGGTDTFDLVAASDVLIYLGDLEPLFRAVRRRLAEAGLFAFTVERVACEEGYRLLRSGRFGHDEGYLRGLVGRHRFEVRVWEAGPLRSERGSWVDGLFVVLGT